MPVTRFTAKIDSGSVVLTARMTRNVPTIVTPPTSGGSNAATRPRKISKESKNSSGNA